MEKIIEIRPCAGGKESECLQKELLSAYLKYCSKNDIAVNNLVLGKTISFIAQGKTSAVNAFNNEGGIHKFQRVAKTERNGRVQTSTISVAVMDIPPEIDFGSLFKDSELRTSYMHCGGPGGQNVNKLQTGVRILHIPTGITVESTEERTQYANRSIALKKLAAKLAAIQREKAQASEHNARNVQIKNGDRAEARRIYNGQRSEIVDKITNRSCNSKEFFKGNIQLLSD